MSFLGDLFDPAGAIATGGNNNTFDSIFSPADNAFGSNGFDIAPSFQDNFNSSFANPAGNFIDSAVNTGLDENRNLLNHFKQNPGQVFYSGADPLSTSVWNKVTGQNNTPFLNQYGGETNKDYQNSQARGIDTSGGQAMGTLANVIAGYYGGAALGSLAGNAYGAMTASAPEGSMGSSALNMQAELSNPTLAGTGSSQAGFDAARIPGYVAGEGAGGVQASNAVSGATRGAAGNTANALDNGNQNPFAAAFKGAATGGLTTGFNTAGALGVEDPQYRQVLNSTINGAAGAGINGGKMDNGAVMGLLSGLGNSYGAPAMNWLTGQQGGQSTAGLPNGGVSNFGNLAAGLGSLYLAGNAMSRDNNQIHNLNSLYGPNSPYAQQLQQSLDRQDAAAGRRSQYGTRGVELQARLAQLNSQNAPMINQLNNQRNSAMFSGLGSLYQMGKNAGAFNYNTGLGNMYSTPYDQPNGPAMTPNSQLGTYNPTGDVMSTMNTIPNVNNGNPNWYDASGSNAVYGG